MNKLYDFSSSVATLVEELDNGIVRVEARRRLPATGVIWSKEGHVVTANHVVRHDEQIVVGQNEGATWPATLIGRDPGTDLALLHVESADLVPPTWLDSDELRVGHLALALGRPGRTVQATLGVVSALGAGWRTATGGLIERYVQTDVLMYPGFSGGPLAVAGADGAAVAGINTSALARGASLALPGETVRRVVETLLTHGYMPRGYLGVSLQPVRLNPALQEGEGQETGVMLLSVEEEGPASKAGMVQGDIIVALDGDPVRDVDDLQALLGGDRVGKEVVARVVRGGTVTELAVKVGQKR